VVGGGDDGEGGKVRIHKFFPFHELNMPYWEPRMRHPRGFIDRYHDVGKVGYDEDMGVGEGGGTKLSSTKLMASSHGPVDRNRQENKHGCLCVYSLIWFKFQNVICTISKYIHNLPATVRQLLMRHAISTYCFFSNILTGHARGEGG